MEIALANVVKFRKLRRAYGTGSLWLRKTKSHPKGVYWVRFYDQHGRQRAMNSGETNENRAWKFLAKQIGKAEAQTLTSAKAARTTIDDLAAAYFMHYKAELLAKVPTDVPRPVREWREQNAEKIFSYARQRWDVHLEKCFGGRRAVTISTDDMNAYIVARRKSGVGNAVINRELALLRRLMNLGYRSTPRKIDSLPVFPERLPENTRKGFANDDQYANLDKHCKQPWLRAALAAAYTLGFRKAELLNMVVQQINFDEGTIALYRGATKNGEARRAFLPDDLKALLAGCCSGKGPDDFVFTWKHGRRVKDFRDAWEKLTDAAGVPGLHFHDLRRSAVRNMVRNGISQRVAMQISGHRTESVFQRYDITADEDLAAAAHLMQNRMNKHKLSTNDQSAKAEEPVKAL